MRPQSRARHPCAPARRTPAAETRARAAQTTNLLLQAGAEAVKGRPAGVPGLAPLRAVKELHRQAADELGVGEDAHAEVEALLGELQQLLIGIAIMQARPHPPPRCRMRDTCVLACTHVRGRHPHVRGGGAAGWAAAAAHWHRCHTGAGP